MAEELRRILKMVEEGRISAEEAERLIRALQDTRLAPREVKTKVQTPRTFEDSLEKAISNFVQSILNSVFNTVGRQLSTALGEENVGEVFKGFGKWENLPENAYGINVLDGDVHINTSPDSHLPPGQYSEKELTLPENADVFVAVVDGNISLDGNFSDIRIHIVDGNMRLKGHFETLSLNIVDGDAHVHTDLNDLCVDVNQIDGKTVAEPGYRLEGTKLIYGEGKRKVRGTIVSGDLYIHPL
ncbi:MAG: hypothetical protein GXO39_07090 [Thermotogae bacterium]|nr:hypothetical protein [Thermotogota bacterium]